jgi:hypothetical protein
VDVCPGGVKSKVSVFPDVQSIDFRFSGRSPDFSPGKRLTPSK